MESQGKTSRRLSSQLKKSMVIYRRESTKNSMGEAVKSDVEFASIFAALWPVSAKELVRNGRESMDVTHRIRIRYLAGITHDMVFKYGTRAFEIVSGPLNVDEGNRLVDILAKEKL